MGGYVSSFKLTMGQAVVQLPPAEIHEYNNYNRSFFSTSSIIRVNNYLTHGM